MNVLDHPTISSGCIQIPTLGSESSYLESRSAVCPQGAFRRIDFDVDVAFVAVPERFLLWDVWFDKDEFPSAVRAVVLGQSGSSMKIS